MLYKGTVAPFSKRIIVGVRNSLADFLCHVPLRIKLPFMSNARYFASDETPRCTDFKKTAFPVGNRLRIGEPYR